MLLLETKIGYFFVLFSVLISLGVGFAVITFVGVCFVLTAGKISNRNIVLSNQSDIGQSRSILSILFNRFQTKSSCRSRLRTSHEYRLFSNHQIKRHLDSSFDSDEEGLDNDEDELYSIRASRNGVVAASRKTKPLKNNSCNNITDIDWDIIGTGLDIDLSSQLSLGMKQSKDSVRLVYDNDGKSFDMIEESRKKRTMSKQDYEFLLLDTSETDASEDEQLKIVIDHKLKDAAKINKEDNENNDRFPDNKLIDFER